MSRLRLIIFALVACCTISALGATPTVKKTKKKKPVHKHFVDLNAGIGIGSLGYNLEGGKTTVTTSFTLGAGYTWFFKPYLGLQTGLSITRYATNASLTEQMEWNGLTDYQGEQYSHRIQFDNWHEVNQTYMLSIPIGVRLRWRQRESDIAGLHAAAGIQLAFATLSKYVYKSGSVTHTAWYDRWHLELRDLPGRYGTDPYVKQEESIRKHVDAVNALLYGEVGTTIRLKERGELVIAAYTHYTMNDFSSVKRDERAPLGFANENNHAYAFMPEYRGLIGTNHVDAMHPWTVGVKVGATIWPGKSERQKKRELRKLIKQFPELVPVREIHDTIWIVDTVRMNDTIRVRDTIVRTSTHIEEAIAVTAEERKLDEILSTSVIWFNFDDYKPILEPAYLLDSVASLMKRHPDLRIHINGHACSIGADSYNQRLALKRAQAVANLLKAKGINGNRMQVKSYGASHPYRYNTAEHQLEKDRRVEIVPEGYVADGPPEEDSGAKK
ncbi:MAG: OmpA family protein [Paludibacteraceae bacterium]|nr:OmpA family protein [Paludibacteraceae bacterium]